LLFPKLGYPSRNDLLKKVKFGAVKTTPPSTIIFVPVI